MPVPMRPPPMTTTSDTAGAELSDLVTSVLENIMMMLTGIVSVCLKVDSVSSELLFVYTVQCRPQIPGHTVHADTAWTQDTGGESVGSSLEIFN